MYLNGLVERLQGSGTSVDLDVLGNPKPADTFYSCSCDDYQHYLWCVHVCVDAMTRKLLCAASRLGSTPPESVTSRRARQ